MFITGISDEAGKALDRQIHAHKTLGWDKMEIRDLSVNGHPAANFHDISEEDFSSFERQIRDAGLSVYCVSSRIANWQKKITEPHQSSLDEARRAISRMRRIGTQYIRIMSFAVLPGSEDQMAAERFKRLREITGLFLDAGLTPLHENCMNYGGMGWSYTLELLENVPGLRLVFDTGNPAFSDDRTKAQPFPKQSAWEFYDHVRDFVDYVHIKDARWDEEAQRPVYCFPGEGSGDVKQIISDLLEHGYPGGFSIEPHLGAVYHQPDAQPDEAQLSTYLEYGRRTQALVKHVSTSLTLDRSPALS